MRFRLIRSDEPPFPTEKRDARRRQLRQRDHRCTERKHDLVFAHRQPPEVGRNVRQIVHVAIVARLHAKRRDCFKWLQRSANTRSDDTLFAWPRHLTGRAEDRTVKQSYGARWFDVQRHRLLRRIFPRLRARTDAQHRPSLSRCCPRCAAATGTPRPNRAVRHHKFSCVSRSSSWREETYHGVFSSA